MMPTSVGTVLSPTQPVDIALELNPRLVGTGTYLLDIGATPVGGPDPDFLFSITTDVQPVPEPPALLLILPALAAMMARRRRRT